MPAFAGLRGTGNWGTDERPKNFREMILWANPNGQAPLTALMAKMRKQTTDDPEFAWFEERLDQVRVQTTADMAVGSTVLTLASGGLDLVIGDVLLVEKTESTTYNNELVQVTAVTSDTSVTISRGAANTTAAGFVTGSFLTRIGDANMEGQLSPNISQRNPTKVRNYTQIFKTAAGITRTAMNTNARTGDAYTNDKKRKAFQHSVKMEWAWFWGVAYENLSGAQPMRFTGGLRSFITTNVQIFTTTPTEDNFIDFVNNLVTYRKGETAGNNAGDERVVFCGNSAWTALNKLARNSPTTRIMYDGVIDVYGMRLTKWVTPTCTLGVRTHPLFNTHPRFSKSMFIVDPTSIVYRPLVGSDTSFQDNIQENDRDGRKGQWLSECGIELEFEYLNGYIGNFSVP